MKQKIATKFLVVLTLVLFCGDQSLGSDRGEEKNHKIGKVYWSVENSFDVNYKYIPNNERNKSITVKNWNGERSFILNYGWEAEFSQKKEKDTLDELYMKYPVNIKKKGRFLTDDFLTVFDVGKDSDNLFVDTILTLSKTIPFSKEMGSSICSYLGIRDVSSEFKSIINMDKQEIRKIYVNNVSKVSVSKNDWKKDFFNHGSGLTHTYTLDLRLYKSPVDLIEIRHKIDSDNSTYGDAPSSSIELVINKLFQDKDSTNLLELLNKGWISESVYKSVMEYYQKLG